MSEEERRRWDARHAAETGSTSPSLALPAVFAPYEHLFPRAGFALDLACGRGATSVWLASVGLDVLGVDISTVAIASARRLASANGMSGRCRFRQADLDLGLPASPPADVVLCHLFRAPHLYDPICQRLKPGGLLAIAVLSEVGDQPGPFRARPGELESAFAELTIAAAEEGDGRAWLLARK